MTQNNKRNKTSASFICSESDSTKVACLRRPFGSSVRDHMMGSYAAALKAILLAQLDSNRRFEDGMEVP